MSKKRHSSAEERPKFIPETQKALACRRVRFTFFDEYEYIMKRSQSID